MKTSDYQLLTDVIITDCQRRLHEVLSAEALKDIYSFVIQYDPVYATLSAHMNTLEAFHSLKAKKENRGLLASNEYEFDFRGDKYNTDEFRYFDFVQFSEHTSQLLQMHSQHVERYRSDSTLQARASQDEAYQNGDMAEWVKELFAQGDHIKILENEATLAIVNAVRGLSSTLKQLDVTHDFTAYVSCYLEDQEKEKELMLHTVPKLLFDQLFPGGKLYDELVEQMNSTDIQHRVNFWLRVISDWILENESQAVCDLKNWRKSRSDIQEEIVRIGEAAVPSIVDYLEHYIFLPQLIEKLDGDAETNAFTKEYYLCSSLTNCLQQILKGTPEDVRRLQNMLQKLFVREFGDELIGLNQLGLAKALWSMDWKKFSTPPEIRSDNNRLLNWSDFGLVPPQ